MQLMTLGAQTVMDAPGRPLPFPAQLLDQADELRIELGGGRERAAGPVLQARGAFGPVAGEPGGHGRARDAELGGDMSDRDAVVQMTFDHAQTPGRGQWCISVRHKRTLSSVDGLLRNFHPAARSPLASSAHAVGDKNLMPHNT